MSDLHETRIDIPEDARLKVVDLLNRQLADTTDLELRGAAAAAPRWSRAGCCAPITIAWPTTPAVS